MSARRFLSFYGLFLFVLCIFIGWNALFLWRAGEISSLEEIVKTQQSSPDNCIYGSSVHGDTYYYKIEGYRAVQPVVAAVGTSRIMQMRSQSFNESFYNLGGSVRSSEDLHNIISAMLAIRPPKIVLMNIDFWWFNEQRQTYYTDQPLQERSRITLASLFLPFSWLIHGKISPGDFFTIIRRGRLQDECSIGLFAMKKREGFIPDGSYVYTALTTGVPASDVLSPGVRFQDALQAISRGEGYYVYGTKSRTSSVEALAAAIQSLEERGALVIPFLPPVAPAVYAAMQAEHGQYAYIDDLRHSLTAHGIHFYDFSDPASIGTSNCEFLDDHHEGDVSVARILRRLYERIQDQRFRSVINRAYLDRVIQQEHGHAAIRDTTVTEKPEIDFLGMGCQK